MKSPSFLIISVAQNISMYEAEETKDSSLPTHNTT